MKPSTLLAALCASLLLSAANFSFAAADPSEDGTPVRKAKEPSRKPNPKLEEKRKEAAKIKLVDINGASAEELKKLPGISDADAAKIIAGRPYASKAHLVTRNIINSGTYESLKKQLIAKQPNKDAADNAALYAPKKEPKK